MRKPQMLLDSFVRKLKNDSAFNGVKFVYAKRNTPAQKPVTEYFVTCGVQNVTKDKDSTGNSNTCTELEFCIYAPYTSGGRELSQYAVNLMEVLDSEDSENLIGYIRVYDSEYDKDLGTLYQKVCVRIVDEFLVQTPEPVETTVNIVVDKVSFAVLKADVALKDDVYRLGELMSGERKFMKLGVRCTVKVTVYRDADPFEGGCFFDVSFDNEERTFCGLKVVQMNETISPEKKPVREYTLEANLKEGSGEIYGV